MTTTQRISTSQEKGITLKQALGVIFIVCGLVLVGFCWILFTEAAPSKSETTTQASSTNQAPSLDTKISALSDKNKRAVSIYLQAYDAVASTGMVQSARTEAFARLEKCVDSASSGEAINRSLQVELTTWALRVGSDNDPAILKAKQMLQDLDVQ